MAYDDTSRPLQLYWGDGDVPFYKEFPAPDYQIVPRILLDPEPESSYSEGSERGASQPPGLPKVDVLPDR